MARNAKVEDEVKDVKTTDTTPEVENTEDKSSISNNATNVEVSNPNDVQQLPEVEVLADRRPIKGFPVSNEPKARKINVDTSNIPIPKNTASAQELPLNPYVDRENLNSKYQPTATTKGNATTTDTNYEPEEPYHTYPKDNEGEATATQEETPTPQVEETQAETPTATQEETPKATQEEEKPKEPESFYEKFLGESEEERQKREKKEKRNKAFAAAGDVLRSIANLYYTHKGGLNTYDLNNTLYGHLDKRYKEAAEQREKNRKNYFDAYVQEQKLKNAARKEDREDRKQAANEVINETKLEIERTKAEQANAVNEARARLYNANADKAEIDRQIKEIDAKYEDKLKQLDIELKEARALYYGASASATTSKAASTAKNAESRAKEAEANVANKEAQTEKIKNADNSNTSAKKETQSKSQSKIGW